MEQIDTFLIKKELSELTYSFNTDDIASRLWIEDGEFSDFCRLIEEDEGFICTIGNETEGKTYIAKNALYSWWARLNLYLAKNKLHKIRKKSLLLSMNSLRSSDRRDLLVRDYIEFGQSLGLIDCSEEDEDCNFPIAYIMSFFSPSKIETAEEYLFNGSCAKDAGHQFERSIIVEAIKDAISQLSYRQQYVIVRRQGILGFNRMTLEEIGQQLDVSRECVRQIEKRTWERLQDPQCTNRFVPLLLAYTLNRKGSLLIEPLEISNELEFICKCLKVPFWMFPYTNTLIRDCRKSALLKAGGLKTLRVKSF